MQRSCCDEFSSKLYNIRTLKILIIITNPATVYANCVLVFIINILTTKFFGQMISQLRSKALDEDTKSTYNKE